MGRWMTVCARRPASDSGDQGDADESLIDELAPHPLMHAALSLSRDGRFHFPMLDRAKVGSNAYVGEHLWLDARATAELLRETRRLRRICRREEFIHGLDGAQIWNRWRGAETSEDFELQLDRIEHLLATAVRGRYWVHLEL